MLEEEEGSAVSHTLLPTGTCFEDVTQEFIRLLQEFRDYHPERILMVHGICLLEDGEPYAHAWIEIGDEAHFPGILDGQKGFAVATLDEFTRAYRVQECTRYNYNEVLRVAKSLNDMPPPWKSQYRRLCRGAIKTSGAARAAASVKCDDLS